MPAFVLFWPAVVWLFVAVATLLTMGGAQIASAQADITHTHTHACTLWWQMVYGQPLGGTQSQKDYRTPPAGHHAEAHQASQHIWHFPGAGLETHRNINSASDVVLATEIQPGPHQKFLALSMGLMFLPFLLPQPKPVPILQLDTLEHWRQSDLLKVTTARPCMGHGIKLTTLYRLGAQLQDQITSELSCFPLCANQQPAPLNIYRVLLSSLLRPFLDLSMVPEHGIPYSYMLGDIFATIHAMPCKLRERERERDALNCRSLRQCITTPCNCILYSDSILGCYIYLHNVMH